MRVYGCARSKTPETMKASIVSRIRDSGLAAYSGEVDQGSGVMPISVPGDSDQVIGAERRWRTGN
jgi:hypothetical protein